MAGIGASLRANTATDLQRVFFDPIDKAHSAEMIANVLGLPFLGFALTIAIGSPLLDYIGMGLLLPMAGVCFAAGALIMMFAGSLSTGAGVYNIIWIGALITGIGWGLVETVVNPLIASLYPEEKTGKLNTLHAWWPGGLVIGGLLGVALSAAGLGWQIKLAVVMLPAVAVVALCIGVRFPPTERAAAGVSMGEMFRQLLNPLFIVLFGSMFLTAASELAPGQWVDFALSRTVHMPGILLLVYVSALMFVMRHFAGPLVHKLSSIGLLLCSCLMASLGLVALSVADDAGNGVGAVSARRRAADGTDGHGGDAVDSLRAADDGRDLRQQEDRNRRRRGRVQRAAAGTRARTRPRHRGADVLPRRRSAACSTARRVRGDLVLRSIEENLNIGTRSLEKLQRDFVLGRRRVDVSGALAGAQGGRAQEGTRGPRRCRTFPERGPLWRDSVRVPGEY